jgi:hypothetical protein
MMRLLIAILCVSALAAASFGCGKGKSAGAAQTKKIGGCTVQTIKIGTGKNVTADVPPDAAWIRVSSVEPAENEVYKKAALDLAKALEMRHVEVYTRSELMHVAEGPCWPPYSVEFRIKLDESTNAHLFKFLLGMPLGDRRPGTERPEGYGPFFVSCGAGSSEWWTVWYR